MALLNAKLHIRSNGEAATPCNLYSTTEEVGGDFVALSTDGMQVYAKMGGRKPLCYKR